MLKILVVLAAVAAAGSIAWAAPPEQPADPRAALVKLLPSKKYLPSAVK